MRSFCLISLLLFCLPTLSRAQLFEPSADYIVCFTPGQDCTSTIVQAIDSAVVNIWVQAYSFTSKPIAQALVLAQERGVKVQIILDKQDIIGKNNIARFFAGHAIPVWIDAQPAIAHNKVMVIDATRTVTGSFNFTHAAQYQNAENVLIITDTGVARAYLNNWQLRLQASQVYKQQQYHTAKAESSSWWRDVWQWCKRWLQELLRAP